VAFDPAGQFVGIGLRGDRQFVEYGAHPLALQVSFVEQLERPLPSPPPATRGKQL
jgi:hypothetical protein